MNEFEIQFLKVVGMKRRTTQPRRLLEGLPRRDSSVRRPAAEL